MVQSIKLLPQELAEALASIAVYPAREDFAQIGDSSAYSTPLRASREFSANGRDYVNKDGVIVNLNPPEQVLLLQLLSKKLGLPLRHGYLKEQLEAACSPQGQAYKQNVLAPLWVYTGEMIAKSDDERKIGRVKDVGILPSDDHAIFEGKGFEANTELVVVRYNLGPIIQTEIPTKEGYFDQISGVIPVNGELKSRKGRGYWNGIYFDKGLSAVGCYWDSVVRRLFANADRPLIRLSFGEVGVGGALGTWTEAPLNK